MVYKQFIKVYKDILLSALQYWEWLKQSQGFVLWGYSSPIVLAVLYILINIYNHSQLVVVVVNNFIGLIFARLCYRDLAISFIDQFSLQIINIRDYKPLLVQKQSFFCFKIRVSFYSLIIKGLQGVSHAVCSQEAVNQPYQFVQGLLYQCQLILLKVQLLKNLQIKLFRIEEHTRLVLGLQLILKSYILFSLG